MAARVNNFVSLFSLRRRLKKDAVPSLFLPAQKTESPAAKARQVRKKRREDQQTLPATEEHGHPQPVPDVGDEVVIDTNAPTAAAPDVDISPNLTEPVDFTSQVDFNNTFSVSRFRQMNNKKGDKVFLFYTGFQSYDHFVFLLQALGPAAFRLKTQFNLPVEDQLFLTLMKLRTNFQFFDLGMKYEISVATAAAIFRVWTNFMFFQLQEADFWPDRDTVRFFLPEAFEEFETTAGIADATEWRMQKIKNLNDQRSSFSTYKNDNTSKGLIVCTPNAAVGFVSDLYMGSTSDRQIFEESQLYRESRLKRGQALMADRGFQVQDLLAPQGVLLNIPHFLRGASQLEADVAFRDRKLAATRIHVERAIGLGKTFRILSDRLDIGLLPLANRIFKVCFWLTKFRPAIN